MPGRCPSSSGRGGHHRAYTRPDGNVTDMRRLAAVVLNGWDGWTTSEDRLKPANRVVADQMETLRVGLADPDTDRFCAAVLGLLGGVPVPDAAPTVRAAVEQLRQVTFPVSTNAQGAGGYLFDTPGRDV